MPLFNFLVVTPSRLPMFTYLWTYLYPSCGGGGGNAFSCRNCAFLQRISLVFGPRLGRFRGYTAASRLMPSIHFPATQVASHILFLGWNFKNLGIHNIEFLRFKRRVIALLFDRSKINHFYLCNSLMQLFWNIFTPYIIQRTSNL